MKVTEQQKYHFDTFGFLVFRQLLTPSEMERFSQEFNAGLDSWLTPGTKHDGSARHYASLMEATTPFIASLHDDPRFAGVAEQLLGKDVLGIAADGNYYVGTTAWHPDGHPIGLDGKPEDYLAVKFTTYLEPQDSTNGALRVIPGSHRQPYHGWLQEKFYEQPIEDRVKKTPEQAFGISGDELPAYAFESEPGDVLIFNGPLWHAAFGGSDHRRMCSIVYYDDPDTPEATSAIQEVMSRNHRMYASKGRQMYTDYYRNNPDPRHQQWVSRMDELGILETPPLAS